MLLEEAFVALQARRTTLDRYIARGARSIVLHSGAITVGTMITLGEQPRGRDESLPMALGALMMITGINLQRTGARGTHETMSGKKTPIR